MSVFHHFLVNFGVVILHIFKHIITNKSLEFVIASSYRMLYFVKFMSKLVNLHLKLLHLFEFVHITFVLKLERRVEIAERLDVLIMHVF